MWSSLLRRNRADSRYSQQHCFFCGTKSVVLPPYKSGTSQVGARRANQHSADASASDVLISTGSPSNWFCSACHCQNTLDAEGKPAEQYTRPMWDEKWNRDRSKLVPHTKPSARPRSTVLTSPVSPVSFSKQNKTVFCHTCQTNQTLLINMLADYLPDEAHPDYRCKLDQLAAYQASLSARYPTVCAKCAPGVQSCIQERDQYTRSWSLARWLELKQHAPPSDSATPRQPSPKLGRKKLTYGSLRPHEFQHTRSFQALTFTTTTVMVWTAYLVAIIYNSYTVELLRDIHLQLNRRPVSTTVALMSLAGVLLKLFLEAFRFNPVQRRLERMRMRNIRPSVHGLHAWQNMQTVFLWTRSGFVLLVLLGAGLGLLEADGVMTLQEKNLCMSRVSLSLLVYEVVTLTVVGFRTRIIMPPELRLVSRPIIGAYEYAHTQKETHQDDLLNGLTLNDDGGSPIFNSLGNSDSLQGENLLSQRTLDGDTWQRDDDGDEIMEDLSQGRRYSQSSTSSDVEVSAQNWPPLSRRGGGNVPSIAYDFQFGPQKFWGPENPTGLEDVFGNAVRLDDNPERTEAATSSSSSGNWSKWFGFV